jgi:MFS family permease
VANGAGPFIGGAVVETATWRWVFWMIPMAAVPAGIAIMLFLPLKHDSGNHLAKLKMIDYGGILLNLAGCLLILVPLSGGGITYAWDSTLVISMLTLGGALWVAFALYEWKLAKVPIMPRTLSCLGLFFFRWHDPVPVFQGVPKAIILFNHPIPHFDSPPPAYWS